MHGETNATLLSEPDSKLKLCYNK